MIFAPEQPQHLVRAAIRIRGLLEARRQHRDLPQPPLDAWEDLQLSQRRLRIAHQQEWAAASARQQDDIQRLIDALIQRLDSYRRALAAGKSRPEVSSLREIHRDLMALYDEFDEVRLDLQQTTLAVTTPDIVLRGIELGRFEIVLNWTEIDAVQPYEVVALEPQPAAGDSSATHPHVHGDHLCEGEGRTSLRRALDEGRLFDFFVLVRQILETYNPGNAYVSLDQWYGEECQDCGSTVSDEESTYCEHCERTLYCECSASCRNCGRTCCTDCGSSCSACEESSCRTCLASCRKCDQRFCHACLTEGTCGDCRLAESETHEDDPEPGTKPPPVPPQAALPSIPASFQPLCLGQADLPA